MKKIKDYIKKDVKKIFDKYAKENLTAIMDNKYYLIEAFVKYYGEEYRSYITNVINNIDFSTFISINTTDMIVDHLNYNYIDDKNYYNELKKILQFYKKYDDFVVTYFSDENKVKNSIISDQLFIPSCLRANGFNIATNNGNSTVHFVFTSFFTDDLVLIHEINHALTSVILSNVEHNGINYIIQKTGLSTGCTRNLSEDGIELEEIINEKSAREIFKIYKNLGGDLNIRKFDNFRSYYETFFPAVDRFYDKYKDIIKQSRITENKNLLFKEIDKDVYLKYEKLIASIMKDYDKREKISNDSIKLANNMIDDMDKGHKRLLTI